MLDVGTNEGVNVAAVLAVFLPNTDDGIFVFTEEGTTGEATAYVF